MTRQAFRLVDGPGAAVRTAECVDLARLVDYVTRAVETLAEAEEVDSGVVSWEIPKILPITP